MTAVSGKSGDIRSVKCTGNIEKSVENGKKLVMFKRIYLHNNESYEKSDSIFEKFSLSSIKKFPDSFYDLGNPSWVKIVSKFIGILHFKINRGTFGLCKRLFLPQMPKNIIGWTKDDASFRKCQYLLHLLDLRVIFGTKSGFLAENCCFLPFFEYCKPHNSRSLYDTPKYFSESLAHKEF